MNRRCTIRDVAERAGVSKATVSLALRNNPRLPRETCLRIQSIARELEYVPDPALSSIAAHRWRGHHALAGTTLAFVTEKGDAEGLAGFQAQAHERGYKTEVFQIDRYLSVKRLNNVLYSRGIRGLVVGKIFKPGFCETFDWSRFSAVACGLGKARPPLHLVIPDHFGAIQTAWQQAIDHGYKRIGLALFESHGSLDAPHRRASYTDFCKYDRRAAGMPIFLTRWNRGDSAASSQILSWFKRHKPQVVIGFNVSMLYLLKMARLEVPGKTAFIDLWRGSAPDGQTACLFLNPNTLGAMAANILDAQLRANERGVQEHSATTTVALKWCDGATLPHKHA